MKTINLIYHFYLMQCTVDNAERMRRLENKRTEEGKKKRVKSKIDRTEEQTLR